MPTLAHTISRGQVAHRRSRRSRFEHSDSGPSEPAVVIRLTAGAQVASAGFVVKRSGRTQRPGCRRGQAPSPRQLTHRPGGLYPDAARVSCPPRHWRPIFRLEVKCNEELALAFAEFGYRLLQPPAHEVVGRGMRGDGVLIGIDLEDPEHEWARTRPDTPCSRGCPARFATPARDVPGRPSPRLRSPPWRSRSPAESRPFVSGALLGAQVRERGDRRIADVSGAAPGMRARRRGLR